MVDISIHTMVYKPTYNWGGTTLCIISTCISPRSGSDDQEASVSDTDLLAAAQGAAQASGQQLGSSHGCIEYLYNPIYIYIYIHI